MDCQKFRRVVFLYLDNEMDGDLLVSFREHGTICPECARQARQAERLVTIFRQRCTRKQAPARLRRSIMIRIRGAGY